MSLGFNVSANKSSGLLGRAEERMQVVKPRLGSPASALPPFIPTLTTIKVHVL